MEILSGLNKIVLDIMWGRWGVFLWVMRLLNEVVFYDILLSKKSKFKNGMNSDYNFNKLINKKSL